jgi:hypothetical protein
VFENSKTLTSFRKQDKEHTHLPPLPQVSKGMLKLFENRFKSKMKISIFYGGGVVDMPSPVHWIPCLRLFLQAVISICPSGFLC